MKRILTASTIALALVSGSAALASGPEHDQHQDSMTSGAMAEPTLEDFVGEIKLPELHIGSKAPELQIAKFVKGDSVNGFDAGQVYVVEFWATWCGPCIAAFPHLSELQAHHGDDVRFIGVNVFERVKDQTERIAMVEKFVDKQGDRMGYTVAVENGTAMGDTWMRPAQQSGIPAAFIVDATGHIAWIGHPGGIEQPLENVVSGKFDPKTATKDAIDNAMLTAGFNKFAQYVQTGENLEDARQIANILISDYLSEVPQGLNSIAWMLLTSTSENIGEADFEVAHKAIALACEKTEWNDWSLLDTYALAAFKVGHTDEAIKWQRKAIELTPATETRAIKELKERLAEYEG